jgi:hypothetical protein
MNLRVKKNPPALPLEPAQTGRTRERLLELLSEDDMTARALEAALGICYPAIRRHLNIEHAAGRIHICSWQEMIGSAGPSAAIYRFGPGADARKPRPSNAKRSRRFREKHAGLLRAKRLAKTHGVTPFSPVYFG